MSGSGVDPAALIQRFVRREAVVGIIGMGYVGLPLMLAAVAAGFSVIGFDIDDVKVGAYNRGASPLSHIGDDKVAAARATGRFEATSNFMRLNEPDAIVICVPTPLGAHREPDLSFVEATARAIAAVLRAGHLVVLESTTWPGTTREVVKPILEETGLRSGVDFFLAFSPEREDPGNATFHVGRIPKVVGGDGEHALTLACAFYDQFVARTVPVSSPETAEATKLTENIFRAVNIALVNELKIVFQAMDIDICEVIEAAKTKPFGYLAFYPGPGLGGHCIPIDPFYLTWKAREYGISTRFIELAGEVNTFMPRYVVDRAARALDRESGKGLNGASVLVVGVAYKKNIDDMRESPALEIIELLEKRGANVDFLDPHIPVVPKTREYGHLAGRRSVELQAAPSKIWDVAVVVTDHDAIAWELLPKHATIVVDTRNRLAPSPTVHTA